MSHTRQPIAVALVCAVLAAAALARCKNETAVSASGDLFFLRADGSKVRLTRAEMQRLAPAERIEVFDPNYKRNKRYLAHALTPLLVRGLGRDRAQLGKLRLLFVASDGYKVAIQAADLARLRAYLAVADLDSDPSWQEVPEHNGVKPGPLYVVWRGQAARDMKQYPWPWQLATVLISPKDLYARAMPTSAPAGSPARAGHAIFLRDCIRCHAINRQGGRLGPELNVPKNVLQYRDANLLRAFIRNPTAFRYGNMPPQRQLDERDLDNVIAYLRVMARHQYDPASKTAPATSGK